MIETSGHLPECPCANTSAHPDGCLCCEVSSPCICNRLRACEQRVLAPLAQVIPPAVNVVQEIANLMDTARKHGFEEGVQAARDADYEAGLKATHEDPNILASYSWSQGYDAGLDAARDAVWACRILREDEPANAAMIPVAVALAAIDALREGK